MRDEDGRPYAMKAIKPSLPDDLRAKFEHALASECAICFSIGTHPNVVSVRRVLPRFFDVETNANGMLVLLDLAGVDLAQAMGRDGNKTSRARACSIWARRAGRR